MGTQGGIDSGSWRFLSIPIDSLRSKRPGDLAPRKRAYVPRALPSFVIHRAAANLQFVSHPWLCAWALSVNACARPTGGPKCQSANICVSGQVSETNARHRKHHGLDRASERVSCARRGFRAGLHRAPAHGADRGAGGCCHAHGSRCQRWYPWKNSLQLVQRAITDFDPAARPWRSNCARGIQCF